MDTIKINDAELDKWIAAIDSSIGSELARKQEAGEDLDAMDVIGALLSYTDHLVATSMTEDRTGRENAMINTYVGLLMTSLDKATELKQNHWRHLPRRKDNCVQCGRFNPGPADWCHTCIHEKAPMSDDQTIANERMLQEQTFRIKKSDDNEIPEKGYG